MRLTEQEKMLLNGEAGEAVRLAMAILVELGEAIGASEMVEVEHVHTDSGFYLAETRHHSCVVRIQRHCFIRIRINWGIRWPYVGLEGRFRSIALQLS